MSLRGNNNVTDWQLDCFGIRQRGDRLLASEQWTDCSFVLGPHREPARAHKLILAMASPVFQAMFYGPVAEEDAPIPVPDIQPNVFQILLKYIYTDKIDLDNYVTAIELYCAAQKYQLRYLLMECTSYLSLVVAPQNACRIYEFANFIGDQKLQDKSLKVIQKKTKEALSSLGSFKNLALGTVIDIFSLDDLTIDNELDLLAAAEHYVIAWRERHAMKRMIDYFKQINVTLQDINKSLFNKASPDGHPENDSLPNTFDVETNGDDILTCEANGVVENDDEEISQPHCNDSTSEDNKNTMAKQETTSVEKSKNTEKEVDRARSEATIRFTVQNFSKLKGKDSSPTCYIRNLPWKFVVRPYYNQRQKSLAFFLQCNSTSKSVSWSCEARAEVKVISPDNDTEMLYGNIEHLFCRRTSNKGFAYHKAWNDIQGYIKDDSVTLEVHVTAETPQGFSWDSNNHASDVELRDVSIQALVRQIRFLTVSAKALAEYVPKTPLLAEHDILAFVMNIISKNTQRPLPEGFSTIRRPRNCTHAPT